LSLTCENARGAFSFGTAFSFALGMGVEEMREEDCAVEKAYDWLEGLFRRPAMRESGKETLDGLGPGLECGWRCLMDGGRLDTGVAKGSLSIELVIVGRLAVVTADQFATSIHALMDDLCDKHGSPAELPEDIKVSKSL
jgi:hypothetical protein